MVARFLKFILLIVAFAAVTLRVAADTYRVNVSSHPLDAYAVAALKVALAHMEGQHQVSEIQVEKTQQRVFEDLAAGKVDIYWAATRNDLETTHQPIRFPIMKGLLGHRVMIIHPDKQRQFNGVSSLRDLQQLSMGQGLGWPDVDILRGNGLNVITTSKYQNLFYMTDGQRFAGFPRGVLEPWTELANHPELNLVVEKRLVLIYHLPFYFFVHRDADELAQKLHRALDQALQAGDFDNFFYNHPMIEDALQRSDLQDRLRFALKVPDLPPETPLNKPEYWLDLDSL